MSLDCLSQMSLIFLYDTTAKWAKSAVSAQQTTVSQTENQTCTGVTLIALHKSLHKSKVWITFSFIHFCALSSTVTSIQCVFAPAQDIMERAAIACWSHPSFGFWFQHFGPSIRFAETGSHSQCWNTGLGLNETFAPLQFFFLFFISVFWGFNYVF